MRTLHVSTPGLMCDACIASVETALASVPGVIGATASESHGTTSVLFDEDQTDPAAIVSAIEHAGFEIDRRA